MAPHYLVTFATIVVLAVPAAAQDHGMPMPAFALPAICTANAPAPEMAMGETEPAPAALDEAHAALGASMDAMHEGMAQGMTAEDIDVAFVCGMIPHHQGAIDMAKAELQYGKDPWVREMAQKVIDAQEAEIAEMLDWLAQHAP